MNYYILFEAYFSHLLTSLVIDGFGPMLIVVRLFIGAAFLLLIVISLLYLTDYFGMSCLHSFEPISCVRILMTLVIFIRRLFLFDFFIFR
jgi:hypothetical protein